MKGSPRHLRVLPPLDLDPFLAGKGEPRLDEEDERFDRVYPQSIRDLSDIHWTPSRVARRAAELLDLASWARVLDVGSGVGKFCLVAAANSPATFVGVERRPNLIEVAESARTALGTSRVAFVHGDVFQMDWSSFHALYFYNPFGEHFLAEEERMDAETFGMDAYDRAVVLTQDHLDRMPAGTRVALYHGFGGGMPASYRCQFREWSGTGVLEIWHKETDSHGRGIGRLRR